MTTDSQPHSDSKPVTLSAAQTAFLTKVTKWGTLLVRTADKQTIRTAESLWKKGLLIKDVESVRYVRYSVPAIVETVEAIEETAVAIGERMDADTYPYTDETPAAPVPTFAVGQPIRFHYFVDPQFKHEIYDGLIIDVKQSSFFGTMLNVKPAANKFNLAPRWITVHQIAKQDAPETAQAGASIPTAGDVKALELAWEDAMMAPNTLDEAIQGPIADRIRNTRTAYMIALSQYAGAPSWMPCEEDIEFLKKASQTASGGVRDVAEMQASMVAPIADQTLKAVHPLRLIQAGSIAFNLPDEKTLKAKRDAQYAEARARVEANKARNQASMAEIMGRAK